MYSEEQIRALYVTAKDGALEFREK